MADYGVKYRFRWNDEGGGDWRIDICQAGYTGDILPRAIGASSVSLRRDRNGNICGTSLELTAECRVDEEFAELYTTDPFEFKVLVYAESVCIWTGYVTPELYSEPFIAPPYDVKVTASDNLGELKLTEWVGVGRLTFAQLLNTLLAQTGLSMGVKYISTLATGSISARAFFSTVTIDLDELSGKSYYDVLDQLLASFHAVIFQHGGSWVVLRETDVVPSISGGAVVPVGQSAGMPIRTLGSAYAGGLWPENHVDLTVEPAKKAISLICPELWNRCGTASITNPSSGNATGTLIATFAAADGINLNDSSTTSRYPLALNIEALRKNRSNKVYYDIVVKVQGNGVTRYLVENTDAAEGYAWQSSSASIKITPGDKLYYAGRGDVSASKSGEVTSIPFPNCDDITALTKIEVTLRSNTIATSYRPTRYLPSVYFFGVWISYDDQFTSLMDTIAINNNARGAASDVNLIVSGLTDVALEKYFISNSLLDGSGSLLGAVHTSAFEGQDYISLLSRDYALSIAAPRLKAEGVFYGQERTDLPLFMSMGGLRYVIETWDWNLITGGVDFSALTLPAASISVTSETIVTGDNLGHGTSGGSGGSGGSSSSGAGYVAPGTGVPALTEAYIGTTRVQTSPTEDQDLTGIGNATLSGKLNLPQGAYLEVVNVGTTANPVYAIHTNIGLYSDSFISAFGASDTGGGGGGLIQTVYGTSGFGGSYSDTDYTNTFNAYAINTLYDRIVALEQGAGTAISFDDLSSHPTTLAGYGITDAKIQNGVITLGGNTITPMTSIGTGSVTNAMLAGSIANNKLANSAITINGSSTALGGSFSTASITAGTAGTSSATSGLSIAIPYVTLNKYGIVTAYGTHTHSISKANITSAIGSTTYAPYNSAGYLPLSGGVMTGPISGVTYLTVNASAQTSYRFKVSGTSNLAGNTSITGTLTVGTTTTNKATTLNGTLSVLGAATFNGASTFNGNVTVDSASSITLGDGVLTWDAQNSAWKLTGNLYATGFISAFGASDTGGGGGGGIDLSAMWANLQVNESGTTGYNLQINPGHLTTALGTYVNAITTTGSGNAITSVSKSGSTLTFTKGSTFALASRTVTGTGYLTGGGALSANRTIDIASTYKGYIDEGHTAYGWGDHSQAGYLTSHQSLANYVTLNSAQTISAVKTFSVGLALNTATSWTSSDRALYFADGSNNSILRYYNVNSNTGLTYNPNTGALKAGSFVKRGGTSSQFLKADGSVDSSVYLTTATAADTYLPLSADTRAFGLYSPTADGVLVQTDCGSDSTMLEFIIEGNAYTGGKVIFSRIQCYYYRTTNSFMQQGAINYGIDLGPFTVFKYNGIIYLWFARTSTYQTFRVSCYTQLNRNNRVVSVSSGAVPDSDVTATVTITPYQSYNSNNLTQSVVTGLIGSTTYAPYNADGYLPLSGGTMTGNLVLSNSTYLSVKDSGGTARAGVFLNSSNGFYVGYGTSAAGYNTYLDGNQIYFQYGTGHATGMTLNSNGNVTLTKDLCLNNNQTISWKDKNGNLRQCLLFNSGNYFHVGFGTAIAGYNTYINGNNIYFRYGTTPTNGAIITSSGNVGIGTTTPTYKLDVAGSIRATERVVATTGFGTIAEPNSAFVASPGWYRIWSSNVNDIVGNNIILFINRSFGNGQPENFAFEINIEGNGAISITQLSGNRQSTEYKYLTKLRVVWAYNTANSVFIDFYYASSSYNAIRVHGYAGKGQFQPAAAVTDTPAHAVEFDLLQDTFKTSKNIVAMGYISAFGVSSTSDARLKKDFRDTTLTVDDIAHAPAITFLWKDREGKRQAGSLAQYWETVLPEVVTDIEGKKGLDYGAAALVSAITIARDVNDHEKRIRELERENRELKRRLGYADR